MFVYCILLDVPRRNPSYCRWGKVNIIETTRFRREILGMLNFYCLNKGIILFKEQETSSYRNLGFLYFFEVKYHIYA